MYSHTIWVVSQGLAGLYLPNTVEGFMSEVGARAYMKDEIEYYNNEVWYDEPDFRFEPYNPTDTLFYSMNGREVISLSVEAIESDYASLDKALEIFNGW